MAEGFEDVQELWEKNDKPGAMKGIAKGYDTERPGRLW